MKCFVTGASGFVGANLVHELVADGHEVRCLIRPGADTRGLAGIRFEMVTGDVTDKSDSLARQMEDCDWVFHVAASYHLWLPEYSLMYKTNVLGTRKIIRAAMKAGVRRIVYTSTVGCIALPRPDEEGQWKPTTESDHVSAVHMTNHYKKSKWQAEVAAREAAMNGAPVIIVNPSTPVGPRDVKPTPTGRLIVDFLNQKMPAYLDTGLNWVSVQDVARGHLLAAEKGRVGERYILGNADGNWTLKKTLNELAKITGLPAPKRQIPYRLALFMAHLSEFGARWTQRHPRIPIAGVRMAKHRMWFHPGKAIEELGFPQTSLQTAFREAVDWFQHQGYIHARPTTPHEGKAKAENPQGS